MEFRENKNQSWVNPPGILAMQGKKKLILVFDVKHQAKCCNVEVFNIYFTTCG